MVYKRVRGWTSGRSLPVLNFVKYPPQGGGLKMFEATFNRLLNKGLNLF